MDDILIRYGIPSKLDQVPYGTQCRVMCPDKMSFDLYLQMSHIESEPSWVISGTFPIEIGKEAIQGIIDKRLSYNQ